jgi:uncharacterized membrane protein
MWSAVIIGAVGCYLCKLAGLSLPERVLRDPRTRRIATWLPVALLATLAAIQTFTTGQHLALDARAAALGVAVVAVLLRAPFLLVVALAAATAALLRLVGW